MDVNNELYRPINLGTSFDKYFEKVSCKNTNTTSGSTTTGMQIMKKLALKYKYQASKIAPTLKGNTIEETVNNIYTFLHDNIQYNIDGYDQNLRSPACSWASRKTGVDCKSFAIFSATILLEMGIKNIYFRKVKQKHYKPTHWTHVYTVVNVKGKKLVIDPTIHQNNEVEYLQKKDLKVSNLPYHSLNAGAVATVSQPITKDHKILDFLFKITDKLRDFGVNNIIIDDVISKTKAAYYRHGGFTFKFYFPTENTLNIDGYVIDLTPQGLNGIYDSLDFSWYTGTIGSSTPKSSNFSTTLGNFQGSGGNFSGSSITTGLDLATGGLASMLSNAIGIDLTDAVDNILAGHWDCVGGTTFDKARVEREITKFKTWYNSKSKQIPNASSSSQIQQIINELSVNAEIFRAAYLRIVTVGGWNSCSKEGINKLVLFGSNSKLEIKKLIKEANKSPNINIVQSGTGTTTPTSDSNPIWQQIGVGNNGRLVTTKAALENNRLISYPIYNVIVKAPKPKPKPTPTPKTKTITSAPSSSKKNTPLILGGMAIASIFLMPKIIK